MKNLLIALLIGAGAWAASSMLGPHLAEPPREPDPTVLPASQAGDYGAVCAGTKMASRSPVAQATAVDRHNGEIYVVVHHADGVIAHCVFSRGAVVRGGLGMF